MTAEDIDAQERAAFVRWRQELARLEEEEKLVLTPFEKNLEVWRQLWRVLERSHIVIQVHSSQLDLDNISIKTNELRLDHTCDIACSSHTAACIYKSHFCVWSL